MNRRELLAAAGALTATAAALAPMRAGAHDGHDHHAQHPHGNPNTGLIASAGDCVEKGELCLAHCLELLGTGDKGMADCAKSVNQMLAMTRAVQALATQKAPLLKEAARVCLRACEDCEAECRPHASKHAECKACGEACLDCARECKALLA